jgi:hypothetical protein
MDGYHLHVAPGKGLIRIFIFVDTTVVEQSHKAVKQVKAQGEAVAIRDDGVVIVVLKRVEKLR